MGILDQSRQALDSTVGHETHTVNVFSLPFVLFSSFLVVLFFFLFCFTAVIVSYPDVLL